MSLIRYMSVPRLACFSGEDVFDIFTRFRRSVATDDAAAMLTLAEVANTREEPLMDTAAVAKHLNVSVDLVQSLAKAGSVRSIKVGRLTRFKRDWLQDFCTPRRNKSRHW